MASNKYLPTTTKHEFDEIAPALRSALRARYDESKSDADRPPMNPATQGAFDHAPDVDSKTVARWSSTVRDFIGCRLNPRLILRGGYDSIDSVWDDLAPKLRASCPDGLSVGVAEGAVP